MPEHELTVVMDLYQNPAHLVVESIMSDHSVHPYRVKSAGILYFK
jgi:hypothetical protein